MSRVSSLGYDLALSDSIQRAISNGHFPLLTTPQQETHRVMLTGWSSIFGTKVAIGG